MSVGSVLEMVHDKGHLWRLEIVVGEEGKVGKDLGARKVGVAARRRRTGRKAAGSHRR